MLQRIGTNYIELSQVVELPSICAIYPFNHGLDGAEDSEGQGKVTSESQKLNDGSISCVHALCGQEARMYGPKRNGSSIDP